MRSVLLLSDQSPSCLVLSFSLYAPRLPLCLLALHYPTLVHPHVSSGLLLPCFIHLVSTYINPYNQNNQNNHNKMVNWDHQADAKVSHQHLHPYTQPILTKQPNTSSLWPSSRLRIPSLTLTPWPKPSEMVNSTNPTLSATSTQQLTIPYTTRCDC